MVIDHMFSERGLDPRPLYATKLSKSADAINRSEGMVMVKNLNLFLISLLLDMEKLLAFFYDQVF